MKARFLVRRTGFSLPIYLFVDPRRADLTILGHEILHEFS